MKPNRLELEMENFEELAVERFFVKEQNIVNTLSPKLIFYCIIIY